MAEEVGNISRGLSGVWDYVTFSLSANSTLGMRIFIFGILIAVVSIFIWRFYKSLASRDLIELNLKKFNRSDHPLMSKFIAMALFSVEYIIVMPFLIMLWYAALSIILLLIANELDITGILVLSAGVVIAVRILAYYSDEVSQELAKLFPFTALSVFLLSPDAFIVDDLIMKLSEIPLLFDSIFSFLLIILGVEIVLRLFYTIFIFWESEGESS